MRNSLLLPLRYILTVLILLVIFTLFKLIPLWGSSYSPLGGMDYSTTREMIPSIVVQVFLLAAVLAAFLSYMNFPLDMRGRFVRFIFMLAATFFVFSAGFSLTLRYAPGETPLLRASPVLVEGRLHRLTSSRYLYPQRVEGASLSGVVIYTPSDSGPGFRYEGQATLDGGEFSTVEPGNPIYSPLFSSSNTLASLREDAAFVTAKLKALKINSQREFLLLCFVLAFYCASCGAVARISRWPVFNIFGLLLMFRALFYLFHLFSADSDSDFAGFVAQRIESPQLPIVILLLIAGILIIWDILFVSGRRKKGGRRYG